MSRVALRLWLRVHRVDAAMHSGGSQLCVLTGRSGAGKTILSRQRPAMRKIAIALLEDSPNTNLEHLADEAAFPARRVLCAHRRGPFGVNRFNRLVERRLRDTGRILANDDFYPGRPIIVTRNDRATGLSNGDTGVVVLDSRNRRRVWFPNLTGQDGDDSRLLVSPSRLAEHESFFALTVHRAQGSEYDEVVFIPGDADSRVNENCSTPPSRARQR